MSRCSDADRRCAARTSRPAWRPRRSPRRPGDVPARVHLRSRPPARRRRRPVVGSSRARDAAAARRRAGGAGRHRRHRAPDLRLRKTGRRARLHRREGLERAARGALHPDLGAGDRRRPAAEGVDQLRARRGETAGRRAGHRAARRRWVGPQRAGAAPRGLGLLRLRHHQHLPPRRRQVLGHRPTHPAVVRAITSIDETGWTAIRYPHAIYDEDEQRWVSDAEVAEAAFTAFTGRRRTEHVTARLIVRRVRRLNPTTVPAGQTEAFAVYRYHAVFTDNSEPMLAAEATHRDHAIIEQVIAELKNGPLAHLPSGRFAANAAWLICAAIAHNLTRAAGVLRRRRPHPRPGRDPAHPADPHPGPGRALRAPSTPAPAAGLALRTRPGRAVPPRAARPPPRRSLTTAPTGPTGTTQWTSRTDRQHHHVHPAPNTREDQLRDLPDPGRWIQAEPCGAPEVGKLVPGYRLQVQAAAPPNRHLRDQGAACRRRAWPATPAPPTPSLA